MERLFTVLIILFYAVSGAWAAKYNVAVKVFSNDEKFSRQPFSYYIDFEREIDLKSLTMKEADGKGRKVQIYVIPVAEFKALIYFVPLEEMDEDSMLAYTLSFESGKWENKNAGDYELGKKVHRNPNLIPNYSFEQVERNIERFLTWDGKFSIQGWLLNDYDQEFAYIDNPQSTCRSSEKQAFEGKRSLCFISGGSRMVNGRRILVSGNASLRNCISLKPETEYKLGFFVKITKRIDNKMNFQGLGTSLVLLNDNKKQINGVAPLSAFYSIGYLTEESYLNKWIYVYSFGKTSKNTRFGYLNIAEKISGELYVDMFELREVENSRCPEIVVGKIVDLTPKKKKAVLRRADGTKVNGD